MYVLASSIKIYYYLKNNNFLIAKEISVKIKKEVQNTEYEEYYEENLKTIFLRLNADKKMNDIF